MFTRISNDKPETTNIFFEGEMITVRKGLNVAAALLEANITQFRETPISGATRAPYCMMGVCFDCLLSIDDLPNQQSCMIEVCEGMRVERQLGSADILLNKQVLNDE